MSNIQRKLPGGNIHSIRQFELEKVSILKFVQKIKSKPETTRMLKIFIFDFQEILHLVLRFLQLILFFLFLFLI